jgi:diketogulonate reductase-like aldo/keto reductase
MAELDITFIETVILSVPEEHRDMSYLQKLWLALEEQVDNNRIYSLGISDLSKQQLEELFNWAKVSRK